MSAYKQKKIMPFRNKFNFFQLTIVLLKHSGTAFKCYLALRF